MGKKITVTPETLTSTAEKIDGLAADYQKVYTSLYGEIDKMKAAWDGEDNAAYTAQVKGFQDDLQKMYKLMIDYSQFLKMSAKSYEATQNDIKTQSGRLTN